MANEESSEKISAQLAPLLRKITDGKVILFLGAGANEGCLNSKGETAPTGRELTTLIKNKFFPEEDVPIDLPTLCACVETRESRRFLEQYIYDVLIDYKPTASVLMNIPLIRWGKIYTTNFDRLLEQAYDELKERTQTCHPIYSDRQLQDFQHGKEVPLYKLHGCITKIGSESSALVLTPEDYSKFRDRRKRLFGRLQDDLWDHTILFLGYSLADPDFHIIFHEAQQDMDIRDFPRCYAVSPGVKKVLASHWESKKVQIIDMKASEFFEIAQQMKIEPYIPPPSQKEQVAALTAHAAPKLDLSVASEIATAFEFVDNRLGYETPNYEEYYRGDKPSWAIIKTSCDAQRTYYEAIMEDILLVDEAKKTDIFELAIITAEAGAGKSTLLMRIAYDHACSFEGFCLFHRGFRKIPIAAIEDLYRSIKKRTYIFIDDAADNIGPLDYLCRRAKSLKLPLTIVCAERKNEWNAVKERLYPIMPIEYELPYLDDKEIADILHVLEKNNYLCALADKTYDERQAIFRNKADKQLLVSMREATEGKDFDKIIQDEFDNIPSDLGRKTYLDISSLYRLGIPIRTGLLKRLSGVSFEDFREKLLKPCERLIVVEYDEQSNDYLYRSRHPHIAEIVCNYALSDPEKIANTYLHVLDKMDLGFASDLTAFRLIVRANTIIDAMPSIEHRRLFYDRALTLSQGDPYVHQQFGIMEMRDKDGALDNAETHLSKACQIEPKNNAYKHSYARLLFRKSTKAQTPAQQDRCFKESQRLLSEVMQASSSNPYAYDSYAENLIYKTASAVGLLKQEYLEEAHEVLLRAIRCCPDKSHLQATESKIFQKLGEYPKARESLLESHNGDPTSARTALLLGRLLIKLKEYPTANKIILETLRYNSDNVALNFVAAQLAMYLDPKNHETIIKFLKKAFDANYIDTETNVLLAVEYFKAEQYKDADEIFWNFRRRPLYRTNNESYFVRDFLLDESGRKKVFQGRIDQVFGNRSGYIVADILPARIYFRPQKLLVGRITAGKRVQFMIGFNLFGPIAQDMEIR